MNLLHLKYAVEVEKTRSINRAAENLFMGQPNLSRAIKELEESLGITIFKRTSKGMSVTNEGEEFLIHAKKILNQIDEFEDFYRNGRVEKTKFSISVPRATYISRSFTKFVQKLDKSAPCEIFYKETNAVRAIRNIIQSDYHLGIIRYQKKFEDQFKVMLNEKGLESQVISEFCHRILISEKSKLSQKEEIVYEDLKDCIEIAHVDAYVPSIPISDVHKSEYIENISRYIYVFERGSQFELLRDIPETFMWTSPVPKDILKMYGILEKNCLSDDRVYKDVLIYRRGYNFTDIDKAFIKEVNDAKEKWSLSY